MGGSPKSTLTRPGLGLSPFVRPPDVGVPWLWIRHPSPVDSFARFGRLIFWSGVAAKSELNGVRSNGLLTAYQALIAIRWRISGQRARR